jgi:hypothetical protein
LIVIKCDKNFQFTDIQRCINEIEPDHFNTLGILLDMFDLDTTDAIDISKQYNGSTLQTLYGDKIKFKHRPQETEKGLRFNENKTRIDLVPPSAILALSDVLTAGAVKYSPRNWEKGMEWSKPYASAMRHMLKFWSGEDIDPETGLPHLAHAMTNMAFLIEYMEKHKQYDDRYKG